jgi:hypothetical protein
MGNGPPPSRGSRNSLGRPVLASRGAARSAPRSSPYERSCNNLTGVIAILSGWKSWRVGAFERPSPRPQFARVVGGLLEGSNPRSNPRLEVPSLARKDFVHSGKITA